MVFSMFLTELQSIKTSNGSEGVPAYKKRKANGKCYAVGKPLKQ